MKRFTQVACLSVAAFCGSLTLAGCGGPDNERMANTTADGKATQDVTSGAVTPVSSEEYNKKMQNQSNQMYTQKGYPKKR